MAAGVAGAAGGEAGGVDGGGADLETADGAGAATGGWVAVVGGAAAGRGVPAAAGALAANSWRFFSQLSRKEPLPLGFGRPAEAVAAGIAAVGAVSATCSRAVISASTSARSRPYLIRDNFLT